MQLQLDSATRFIVGYSGGRDSQVLLHSLVGLISSSGRSGVNITAAHFNHDLHADCDLWEQQCRVWAKALNFAPLEFVTGKADKLCYEGENIEAAARRQRYRWLNSLCRAGDAAVGDVVLTAHHLNDQAETFLAHLFKGKGVSQLRGIVSSLPVVAGSRAILARPLLAFSREQLDAYARLHGLIWLDDPANFNTDFDRSFIRQKLLPILQSRNANIVDDLCCGAKASAIIHRNTVAHFRQRWGAITLPESRGPLCRSDPLDALKISENGSWYFNEAVRFWLHGVNINSPSNKQLEQLFGLVEDKKIKQGSLSWGRWQIGYFHNRLYLLTAVSVSAAAGSDKRMAWNGARLKITESVGIAMVDSQKKQPLTQEFANHECANHECTHQQIDLPTGLNMRLCWRVGGERVNLKGKNHSESCKKLFQAKGLPPWERNHLPHLRVDEEIAWIHGIGTTTRFPAKLEQMRLVPRFYAIHN